MKHSYSSIEYENLKHRFRKGAVLSGLGIMFGIIFLVGAAIIISLIHNGIAARIPGRVLGQSGPPAPPPVNINIPSIGVSASVVKLGLNADGTLQVPVGDTEVGWYVGSPAPGALGPAIMVGHLDSAHGVAVFQNLKNLKSGDIIEIIREDGSSVSFKVNSSQQFSQDDFPTDQVYGTLDYPGLRLITCSGAYSRLKGRYPDNLVVFATYLN